MLEELCTALEQGMGFGQAGQVLETALLSTYPIGLELDLQGESVSLQA